MMSLFLNWFIHVVLLSGIISVTHVVLKKMNFRATNRYFFLQITFLTLPLFAFIGQFQFEEEVSRSYSTVELKPSLDIQLPEVSTIGSVDSVTGPMNLGYNLGLILIFFYILFVTFGLFKIFYSYKTLSRIHKDSKPVVIDESIVIYSHQENFSPAAFGLFNPVILIPQKLINELSKQDLKLIVLHESEHIKRFDPLFNIIRHIVKVLTFFSPFTKWLSCQYEEDMEISLDESLIVSGLVQKKSYGYCLVNLCEKNFIVNSVACNGLSRKIIERRIRDMKNIESMKNNKKFMLLVAGVLVFIGAAVPVLGFSAKKDLKRSSDRESGGELTKSLVKNSSPDHGTLHLDYFLVNLKRNKESKLLKLALGFETNNLAVKNEINTKMMQVRDIIIIILSSKELREISMFEGKKLLKVQIRDTLNSFLKEGKIEKVYFSQFIYN